VADRRFANADLESVSTGQVRIVEHELDMERRAAPARIGVGRFERLIAWFMPNARHVAPPMRSVARELEELMPSRDN
jgi:hypothetical protein